MATRKYDMEQWAIYNFAEQAQAMSSGYNLLSITTKIHWEIVEFLIQPDQIVLCILEIIIP